MSARDHTTRYRRVGTGRALIVLAPPVCVDGRWAALADALARRWRVVLPEVPAAVAWADAEPAAAWLHDFLDALGTSAAALVAGAPFGDAALRVAAARDDLCARVVLVHEPTAAGPPARWAPLGAPLLTPPAAVSTCVWRWDPAEPDAAGALERCLTAAP